MPYAVWKKKGAEPGSVKYEMAGMPALENDVAIKITDEQAETAKRMYNVTVFEKIKGLDEPTSNIRVVLYKGKKYTIKDGTKFDPPINDELYEEMQEKGMFD